MVAMVGPLTLEQMRSAFLRQSLVNVIRVPALTCRVCAAPVAGFELCWQCREHNRIAGVADTVAPLTYAIGETDSAGLLRNFKNHPVRSERARCAATVSALVGLAIWLHEPCFGAVVGLPVSCRVVIPSLTSRPGTHPLTSVAGSLGLLADTRLVPALDARCDRTVSLEKFAVVPGAAVAGRHVLVIDDVWTTGSNAQSAALTLRRAGAAAVTVLVVGRWLNPRNELSARLIEELLGDGYDPLVCPVTGDRCP
jgi:hypothetical protein